MAFLLGYAGNTRAAYANDLSAFFAWCATFDLDPLVAKRAHIDAYARECTEVLELAPATVARRIGTLSGYFKYAISEDVIARNPVEFVNRPKVDNESTSTGLDGDELRALLAAAQLDGHRTYALVMLLGMNGLRVSEALSASVADLGTERGHRVLRIVRKGGKRATVPLAPKTASAIDAWLEGRTSGRIFSMDRSTAWRLLRRLAGTAVPDKAGSLHPHDLRHAFVTLALDAGATLQDVQDAAGHADPRTTQRYNRARDNLDKHPTYALAGLI